MLFRSLQLQLESYKELTTGSPSTIPARRKTSLAKREKMMMFALKSFKDQLKLESEAILEGKVELRDIPAGFRIMEEDSLKDAVGLHVLKETAFRRFGYIAIPKNARSPNGAILYALWYNSEEGQDSMRKHMGYDMTDQPE